MDEFGPNSPGSRPGRFHIGFYGIRNAGSRQWKEQKGVSRGGLDHCLGTIGAASVLVPREGGDTPFAI